MWLLSVPYQNPAGESPELTVGASDLGVDGDGDRDERGEGDEGGEGGEEDEDDEGVEGPARARGIRTIATIATPTIAMTVRLTSQGDLRRRCDRRGLEMVIAALRLCRLACPYFAQCKCANQHRRKNLEKKLVAVSIQRLRIRRTGDRAAEEIAKPHRGTAAGQAAWH
jgi:hypothetical protein